ncbi:MAG: glycogen synthase [Anaerolineae bacterium]|nr:glycogen synthase [Anaerolineae bacterium]
MTTNVLFVSAEAAPFAKVGGLADVVGSLPQALRKLDIDARLILPHYGFISDEKYKIVPAFDFEFPRVTGVSDVYVFTTEYDGVPIYFVQAWPFFGNETSVYTEWNWDVPRYLFFNQVAMAVAWELKGREGWFPDVFHVHDWHTGLIPFLISESRRDPLWAQTASVVSIHNMAYQGDHTGGWLWQLGIAGRHHPELVSRGLTDNLLAMSIAYADMVSTVSPRYATEIQYPYMGYGLDELVRTRVSDLAGILNGLDVDYWNPATDPLLVSNYTADDFEERRLLNKREMQRESGLEVRDDIPMIGIVSRFVKQKGFDLALPALRRLLADTEVQFVALGTGEPDLEYQFWRLGKDFYWRAKVYQGFNAAIAQRIYAACDMFLMPSHFEPCGIGQMVAMRYGSLPVVRETGGLADTVQNYDNGAGDVGTGFVFQWEQPDAVLGTLRWAIDVYYTRKDVWRRMQRRAMQTEFSWEKSARAYADVYRRALEKHRGHMTVP